MRATPAECERIGHSEGLAAGLATALAAVAAEPPGRVAALPLDRLPAGAEVIRHEMAAREGVGFARRPASTIGQPSPSLVEFAVLLGAVRLGVTRRLLEAAVTHLSGRTVGGEPTIRKQLVLGTVADAVTAVDAARECLLVAGTVAAAVIDVHDRLTEVDWEITKLLGASGFLTDSPSRAGLVSRLTANCWVPRPVDQRTAS